MSSNAEGRSSASRSQAQSSALRGRMAGSSAGPSSNAAKAAEYKRLMQKKERLKFAVDRLELQSQQKQRQLRKSMAVQ